MAFVDGQLGPRVRWAFADRSDGVSLPPYDLGNLADHVGDDIDHVLTNRAALAARVGVDGGHVVTMAPVHGNDVAQVAGPSEQPVAEVDALVTTVPGLALLVLAADCVPVLLGDSGRGVVAVVHAGWRGVRSDVVGQTLTSMADLGARLDRVRAVVGPAICGRCYEVGPEVVDAVALLAPAAVTTTRTGTPAVDLVRGVVDVLTAAGVAVEVDGRCTFEDTGLYSFRRDGVTGRHAAVVGLVPA